MTNLELVGTLLAFFGPPFLLIVAACVASSGLLDDIAWLRKKDGGHWEQWLMAYPPTNTAPPSGPRWFRCDVCSLESGDRPVFAAQKQPIRCEDYGEGA